MTAPSEDRLRASAKINWERKERGVAHQADYNMPPDVVFYAKDNHLASALCMKVDRDHAIAVANLLAVPLEADCIMTSLDARMTSHRTNPATGQPWVRGEMSSDGDVCIECIITCGYHVDGTIEQISRSYRNNGDGTLTWLDEGEYLLMTKTSAVRFGGFVSERFQSAFVHVGITDLFGPGEDRMDPMTEAYYLRASIIAITAMVVNGLAILYNPSTPREAEILDEVMCEESISKMQDVFGGLLPRIRATYGIER